MPTTTKLELKLAYKACDTDNDYVLDSIESVNCINALTNAMDLYEPLELDIDEQAKRLFFSSEYWINFLIFE